MSPLLTRSISATLVAVFAILASAAALCLVPCELRPSITSADTATGDVHHCSEPPAPAQGGTAMNGIEESCADQHAWDAPATDRTASRASAPGLTAGAITTLAVQLRAELAALRATAATPPDSPPRTITPLRI
jgi:hypothetical protein